MVDLLAGLLDGWDLTLAPPVVITNVGSLRRAGSGYRTVTDRLVTVPDLWIELDPWAGPGASPSRAEGCAGCRLASGAGGRA